MKTLITNAIIPDFIINQLLKKNIVIENNSILDIFTNPLSNTDYFDNVIDANNKVVSSGFIDVHSHSDLAAFGIESIKPKYTQGIRTEVVGNCGLSVCPLNIKNKEQLKKLYSSIWGYPNLDWEWTDTFSYLNLVRKKSPVFIETLIGYSTLRFFLTGLKNIPYDKSLLSEMEKLIESELNNGAKGISLGIPYPPNVFAGINEYHLITKILKKHDKILAVHIRDEGNNVIDSIEEIIDYIKINPCKLHISHLKTYGEQNWGKNSKLLNIIDDYNKQGFDITFDAYPYDAGSTTLNALLPPALLDKPLNELLSALKNKNTQLFIESSINNGIKNWENYAGTIGFENIFPIGLESNKYNDFTGKSIAAIAHNLHKSFVETLCDIIINENGNASMLLKAMNLNNIEEILKHPKSMIGSDALFSKFPHPRTYGTFPRIIRKFCNEMESFDLITALYKMTKLPAERFNINKKGEIKKGYSADLITFNPDKVKDNATFEKPLQFSDGIITLNDIK